MTRADLQALKQTQRALLLQRDGPRCAKCRILPSQEAHTIHHRDGNGANWADDNLELRCRSCNTGERNERIARLAKLASGLLVHQKPASDVDGIDLDDGIDDRQQRVRKALESMAGVCVCAPANDAQLVYPAFDPTFEGMDRLLGVMEDSSTAAIRANHQMEPLWRTWVHREAWKRPWVTRPFAIEDGAAYLQAILRRGSIDAVSRYWRVATGPTLGFLRPQGQGPEAQRFVLWCPRHKHEPDRSGAPQGPGFAKIPEAKTVLAGSENGSQPIRPGK